jgi:TPR repeat protein
MTQDGDGGPKDDAAAKILLEKAAALDHHGALERPGAYAEAGRAGPKDEQAAIAFYKQAAALGDDDAADALKRLKMSVHPQGQERPARRPHLLRRRALTLSVRARSPSRFVGRA